MLLPLTSGSESADLQRFVTEHAWDAVWNRPGLNRRGSSLHTTSFPAVCEALSTAAHSRGGSTGP